MNGCSPVKTFDVKSGNVHLSDPCYDRATVRSAGNYKVPAQNGTWLTTVVYDSQNEPSILLAAFENEAAPFVIQAIVDGGPRALFALEKFRKLISVDSGQVGIFDDSLYPKGSSTGDIDDENTFYGKACEITLSGNDTGVIDNLGAVSRTAHGDGSYDAYVSKNANGEAVILAICLQYPS